MQAVHGHVVDVKKIRTRQVVQIVTEIPTEHYAQTVAFLDDQKVLITQSALDLPFGVVDGSDGPKSKGPEPKQSVGPLCKWAVIQCTKPGFQIWLGVLFSQKCVNEIDAKRIILEVCGITSRKDLDTNRKAHDLFNDLIRKPWMEDHPYA